MAKFADWIEDSLKNPKVRAEYDAERLLLAEGEIYVRDEELAYLEAELREAREDTARLEKTFRHYHVALYDEDMNLADKCDKCGLDIRNDVHIRTPSREEKHE